MNEDTTRPKVIRLPDDPELSPEATRERHGRMFFYPDDDEDDGVFVWLPPAEVDVPDPPDLEAWWPEALEDPEAPAEEE